MSAATSDRCLLAIATSAIHKENVARIVERFGPAFEKWLFVWDGSTFEETQFADCRVIHRDRFKKCHFALELLTPDAAAPYDYVFLWDDDVDVDQFYPELFLEIMRRNELEMAQPALAPGSHVSHRITLQHPGIGRFTDFVEVMAPVWTRAAWKKWHAMLVPENHWGWGYDVAARSACGYDRMGIIDCTPVRHFKPVKPDPVRAEEMRQFFQAHPEYRPARGQVLGPMKF
jgi:hypothetical protein